MTRSSRERYRWRRFVTEVIAIAGRSAHSGNMAGPALSVTRDMELPEILSRYPACRKVFDRYGSVGCGGPLGSQESLAFFARAHRADEACLLAELKEAARHSALEGGSPDHTPGPVM
jgi:hypothetical protein